MAALPAPPRTPNEGLLGLHAHEQLGSCFSSRSLETICAKTLRASHCWRPDELSGHASTRLPALPASQSSGAQFRALSLACLLADLYLRVVQIFFKTDFATLLRIELAASIFLSFPQINSLLSLSYFLLLQNGEKLSCRLLGARLAGLICKHRTEVANGARMELGNFRFCLGRWRRRATHHHHQFSNSLFFPPQAAQENWSEARSYANAAT